MDHDRRNDRTPATQGATTIPDANPAVDWWTLACGTLVCFVEGALADGARVTTGGRPTGEGAFYEPTVVVDVAHGTTIKTTEISGPVAAVVGYDSVTEAVRMANNTEYGLISYVYGEPGLALEVAALLEAGMVGASTCLGPART